METVTTAQRLCEVHSFSVISVLTWHSLAPYSQGVSVLEKEKGALEKAIKAAERARHESEKTQTEQEHKNEATIRRLTLDLGAEKKELERLRAEISGKDKEIQELNNKVQESAVKKWGEARG